MGKDRVVLEDGTVFDLNHHFPNHLKTVILSMSGGVESTLLCYLLVEQYGAKNVRVMSGQYVGRRWWEAANARRLATMIGVHDKNFHAIVQTNQFMSAEDNWNMYMETKRNYIFDGWYNGTNAKLFTPSNVTSKETVKRLYNTNHFLPFAFLEKHQTIDLYYKLGLDDLLYMSYSCTTQSEVHCGKCPCCYERVRGFATLGKKDQATYNVDWDKIVDKCYKSDEHLVNKKET